MVWIQRKPQFFIEFRLVLFYRICGSKQSIELVFVESLRVEDVIDNLLVRITVDGQQVEILRDSFLVDIGQFFMLLG